MQVCDILLIVIVLLCHNMKTYCVTYEINTCALNLHCYRYNLGSLECVHMKGL